MGSLLISGCADQASIYPLDDATLRSGIPKIEFVRFGLVVFWSIFHPMWIASFPAGSRPAVTLSYG